MVFHLGILQPARTASGNGQRAAFGPPIDDGASRLERQVDALRNGRPDSIDEERNEDRPRFVHFVMPLYL